MGGRWPAHHPVPPRTAKPVPRNPDTPLCHARPMPVHRVPRQCCRGQALLTIDCDDCVMRDTATCDDCVVTYITDRDVRVPLTLDPAERRAVHLLSQAGLVPALRHRGPI